MGEKFFILLHTDNKGVWFAVNCLSSKCPLVVKLVHHMVLLCLQLTIWIKAKRIPGTSNTIADALSRFQFAKFRELVLWADEVGAECPDYLLGIGLVMM